MATLQQSFIDKASKEEQMLQLFFKYKNKESNKQTYTLEFMKDSYSPYDAIILKNGKPMCIAEVKVRSQYTYDQIQSFGGSYLELLKVTGMTTKQKEETLDLPMVYFNFYKDKAVVYNLSKDISSYEWEMKNLQKNDYDKKPIWKHVTKLNESSIKEIVEMTKLNSI